MSSPGTTIPGEVFCSRHPATPTLLRCGRCGTPICPRCMITTEVGQRCPNCGRGARLPTYQVGPAIIARGAVAGLGAATAIAYLWSLVPGFAFWLGLLMGFGAGEAVAWATNRKRGRLLMATAAITVVVGFLLGYLVLGRGAGAGALLAYLVNPLLLARLGMFTLISLSLAVVIAALRQRG